MRTFLASAYLRNGRKHAAAEFEIEATRWPVAAYRAVKAAMVYGHAAGVKRPKLMEIKLSRVVKGEE